jgi:hypothetical protein
MSDLKSKKAKFVPAAKGGSDLEAKKAKYVEPGSYTETMQKQKDLDRGVGPAVIDAVPDLALLGAHGASMDFLDEAAGGAASLVGGDYESARNLVRNKVDEARERRGLLGTAVETAGSVLSTAVLPGGALKGGAKVVRELGLAATQGLGSAETMEDAPMDMALSTGVSALSQGTVGALKKTVADPKDILARSAGARGTDFRRAELLDNFSFDIQDKVKDPAGIASRLDAMGFYKSGDRTFDPSTRKFVLNPTKGKMEAMFQAPTLESYLFRTQQAVNLLSDENNKLIKGKKVPMMDVLNTLKDTHDEFIPKGFGVEGRGVTAMDLYDEVIEEMVRRKWVKGSGAGQWVDAENIQELKQLIGKKVKDTYKAKGVSDIKNETVEAMRRQYTKLDQLLDTVGGDKYANNNDTMRDLLAQKELIHWKSGGDRGRSMSSPGPIRESMLDQIKNMWGDPAIAVPRANVGEFLETPAGDVMDTYMKRAPVEFMNEQRPRQRPVDMKGVPNIPEQLIRTPLPRNTQQLQEKKPFVLAKIAQMMPEMFDAVKDVFDNNPENLGELAQVISMQMPHVFEKDKYNRFDGRILSEKDKQMAIKDTLLRKDINSIQQAKIITKLNQEGIFEG